MKMAVLSAVSEWDHYLCSSCSTMSALRPGMLSLTVIDPLSRWPTPAFTRDDRPLEGDDRDAAMAPASIQAPTEVAPVPPVSLPVSHVEPIPEPIDAAAPAVDLLPTSTRMREIVVQAERTDNPWGI